MRWVWGIFLVFCLFSSASAHECRLDLRELVQRAPPQVSEMGYAVAVIIIRDGQVLLHKRKSGFWGFAGGKYETQDRTIEDCARREAFEETGLRLKNLRFKALQQTYVGEARKFLNIAIVAADVDSHAEPELKEPDKGGQWQWFSWDNLPNPLFPPNEELIASGLHPF